MDQNQSTNNFYMQEDRRDQPKDYFKLFAKDLMESVKLSNISSVCDIGCATGDLLWYLSKDVLKDYPQIQYFGMDSFPELLSKAEERMNYVKCLKGNINQEWNSAVFEEKKFDIITFFGVIYLFDNYKQSLSNIISMLTDGGTAYVFSSFNQYGFDVNFSYKAVKNRELGDGNIHIFSIHEISKWLENKEVEFTWIPFEINTELTCNPDNGLRAWTIRREDGTLGQIDGLNRWREQFFLKIKKKTTSIKKQILQSRSLQAESTYVNLGAQVKLLIEITNQCNNSCIFCANKSMSRKKGNIDNEIMEKALQEAYENGIRQVGFYTTGEPLLNTQLPLYLKSAKSKGFEYCYITTNGLLAQVERVAQLYESGLDSIKFSINAINKEEYKFIHGVDCFNTVIKNLRDIYEWRNHSKASLKISVSYIATRYTQHNVEEIEQFFLRQCDEAVVMPVNNAGGLNSEILPELECQGKFTEFGADINCPCHYLFDTVTVTHEGYVTACCIDFQNYLVYGNLRKQSLAEIWNNENITQLRKQHMEKALTNNLCRNCINKRSDEIIPIMPEFSEEYIKSDNQKEDISGRISAYLSEREDI